MSREVVGVVNGVWTSNRAAVAPDVREDVARAEARMRAVGWRVQLQAASTLPCCGYLDVARCPEIDLRSDAGTVRLVLNRTHAGVFRAKPHLIFADAYIRSERPTGWTDTFTPTPVRIRDPGVARRALRISGQHRSSKRVPISLLKRAAERYLNRPVHHRVDGVVFEVSVSLGHFVFDSVDRIVHAWPNRGCEGWAAIAWEGWDGYTHVERDACLDVVLVEHRSERRWVTARDLAISGSAGAWRAGRPTHPSPASIRRPDGGP